MSTATIAPVKFYILEGPSADRVMDALEYAFVKGSMLTVKFSGVLGSQPRNSMQQTFAAQITGIRYESGKKGMLIVEGNNLTSGGSFHGFYNANTRKGTFDLKR